jgi:hypothetical protein
MGLTLLPHAATAASNICMGHKVDVMGTPKADLFEASWNDDKNGDGWIVYAGGKGDDRFMEFSIDSGSVTNNIACGYAGNDAFGGAWTMVDGGSGGDYADIMTCWLGGVDYPIRNTEFVGVRPCPENVP